MTRTHDEDAENRKARVAGEPTRNQGETKVKPTRNPPETHPDARQT